MSTAKDLANQFQESTDSVPRIMFIFPSKYMQESTLEYLTEMGYSVTWQPDPTQAIKQLISDKYDLICLCVDSKKSKSFQIFKILKLQLKMRVSVFSPSHDHILASTVMGFGSLFF